MYLSQAFVDGFHFSSSFGASELECHRIGHLLVTSGQIVACDPLTVSRDEKAFVTSIPPGRHAVILSVARFDGEHRVAFAKLELNELKAVRWEMALTPGQKIKSLKEGGFFGYPVDTGTGCFVDRVYVPVLVAYLEDRGNRDRMIAQMGDYFHPKDWLDVSLNQSSDANVILFSTGVGDGCYPSFFGYSESGVLVELVTDFLLFEDKELMP